MTKVHKVTLLIVDHDQLGDTRIVDVIENTRYPNRCIGPDVMDIETREVEWSDWHPLNRRDTMRAAFEALFASKEG